MTMMSRWRKWQKHFAYLRVPIFSLLIPQHPGMYRFVTLKKDRGSFLPTTGTLHWAQKKCYSIRSTHSFDISVCQRVAIDHETRNKYKQMPFITSTLTRLIKFHSTTYWCFVSMNKYEIIIIRSLSNFNPGPTRALVYFESWRGEPGGELII